MRTTALDDTDTYIQALHAYVQDAPVHRLVEAFRTSAEPSYTKLVRKMLRIPRFQESERFLPRTLAQWLQVAACTQMPWYYHPDNVRWTTRSNALPDPEHCVRIVACFGWALAYQKGSWFLGRRRHNWYPRWTIDPATPRFRPKRMDGALEELWWKVALAMLGDVEQCKSQQTYMVYLSDKLLQLVAYWRQAYGDTALSTQYTQRLFAYINTLESSSHIDVYAAESIAWFAHSIDPNAMPLRPLAKGHAPSRVEHPGITAAKLVDHWVVYRLYEKYGWETLLQQCNPEWTPWLLKEISNPNHLTRKRFADMYPGCVWSWPQLPGYVLFKQWQQQPLTAQEQQHPDATCNTSWWAHLDNEGPSSLWEYYLRRQERSYNALEQELEPVSLL